MIASMVRLFFMTYTLLLFVRIVGSWFPQLAGYSVMHYVSACTDPYLNVFRRFIPPIGGMLDLSPILAFLGLQIVENILLRFVH